ncbi:MAG: PQQ-dependent sugar dehydrogenase [Solirubrobacterales bacterium]
MTSRLGATGIAIATALAGLVTTGAGGAETERPGAPGLELRRIATFDEPTYVTQAPGEPQTLYVTTQRGRVMAVRKGRRIARPFLDISDRVRSGFNEAKSVEAGLFSIAFDPAHATNGHFFVFYTGPGGHNFVDRYQRSGADAIRAHPGSRRSVLKILHPWTDSHNGGQLQFGPDGNLWISTGDGGCCNDYHDQARSLGSLLGKLLRIDPRPTGAASGCPRAIRSSGRPAPTRSTPGACATRGAFRSTASPATW